MSRRFNPIFKSLVKKDNDLPGLCAYAVYKREKIKLIEDYKHDNFNQNPSDDYLEEFHEKSMNELDRYREMGNNNCDAMIAIAIGKAVQANPDILRQTITENAKPPKDDIKKKKDKPFIKSVLASVVGGVVLFILPYILVVIGLMINPGGTKRLIKKILPQASENIESIKQDNSNLETTYFYRETSIPTSSFSA